MSNTRIQIKRSQTTGTPPGGSLQQAELAYSYTSGKLYIGSANGLDVIALGGNYFLNQSNAAFDVVNAAYTMANMNYTVTNAVYTSSNAAYVVVNAAWNMVNSNYATTNAAWNMLNTAFTTVNAVYTSANANYVVTNAVYTSANANYVVTNAAFNLANTKFASAGGTISGDVNITGDLSVHGNTYLIDQQTLRISDPLIYLAGNNYTSDVVDIGFVANYVNTASINVHTGLFRSAGTKEYYLFQEYNKEPDQNYIDPNGNNFSLSVLHSDIVTGNLKLNGANAYVWIKTNFDTTNAAYVMSNMNYTTTNAAWNMLNTAFTTTNAAYTMLNTAFTTVNAVYTSSNANYVLTNSAFTVLNAAYTSANANYVVTNSAFNIANVADQHAANASYMNTGTVPENLVVGNYRNITGLGTINIGTWQANTVEVLYGGTGVTSFTQNGIVYGNTTGHLNVTGAGTEGQVLQATVAGVPFFGMLDGGGF